MSFNQFTNLDFSDLRSQIKDYLRSNSNFTDFDFEGSNFSVLIDTLAYNSYITAFNSSMIVNESFLDSASKRSSIVSRAKEIGYIPYSATTSSADPQIWLGKHSIECPIPNPGKKETIKTNGKIGKEYIIRCL